MKNISKFFNEYPFFLNIIQAAMTISVITAIVILLCLLIPQYFCKPQIVTGFFTLTAALTTAIIAIHKYVNEQRISRLQKIYFEDTLLGLSKFLEEVMAHNRRNCYLSETLCNLTCHLLNQNKINLKVIKDSLTEIYQDTLAIITPNINNTEFKKETISKLLFDAGIKSSLPNWINEFEKDSYRFAQVLKGQIITFLVYVKTLDEDSNLNNFKQTVEELLGNKINDNFLLIKRYEILISLFSEIVLEFTNEKYTTIDNMKKAFQKTRIKNSVLLLNDAYTEIIGSISSQMGNINKEDAIRLDEKMKCIWKKIGETIWNQKK